MRLDTLAVQIQMDIFSYPLVLALLLHFSELITIIYHIIPILMLYKSKYKKPNNEEEWIGSTSGSADIPFFTAAYNTNADIAKFKKRAVEQLRYLIGNNFDYLTKIQAKRKNLETRIYT